MRNLCKKNSDRIIHLLNLNDVRSGRFGVIVKVHNSAPTEENKFVDLYAHHAHNRNHKMGAQVGSEYNYA